MEGSPVDAVSLGATTGGGTLHTKAEEFKRALEALGEGWLLGHEGGASPPEGSSGNGATVRLAADLPCQLQVGAGREGGRWAEVHA